MPYSRFSRLLYPCACALLLVGGCVDDTIWLPDSSGVVYLRSDHSIVHYDLKTRQERVLVKQPWLAHPGRPIVSTDGKQLALVKHRVARDGRAVQVFTYDFDGKQLHASAEYRLPGDPRLAPTAYETAAWGCWSPDGQHLLIVAVIPDYAIPAAKGADKEDRTPIATLVSYDLGQRQFRVFSDVRMLEEAGYGFSPITPDGKAFLADSLRRDIGGGWPVLVSWEGRVQSFKVSDEAGQMRDQLTKERRQREEKNLGGGEIMPPLRWISGVAVGMPYKGRLLIDPVAREIRYQPSTTVAQLWTYANGGQREVLPLGDGVFLQARDSGEGSNLVLKIDLVQRIAEGEGWTWKTTPVTEVDYAEGLALAPNGKVVLLQYTKGKQAGRLLIDDQGRIVADLKR